MSGRRIRGLLAAGRHRLAGEVLRFAVVGSVGYASDVAVFNLLRGVLDVGPLPAKALSLTVSTTVAYVGNRYWTYRDRPRQHRTTTQYVLFYLVNGVGAAIELAILWFSHSVLGLQSLLADNIAGNVIGMAASTLFRFWGYRTLVFRAARPEVETAVAHAEAASVPGGTEDGARDVAVSARTAVDAD